MAIADALRVIGDRDNIGDLSLEVLNLYNNHMSWGVMRMGLGLVSGDGAEVGVGVGAGG